LAGRAHKPIKILFNDNLLIKNIASKLIIKNRVSALAVALLLNEKYMIPENELYTDIVNISYKGGIN
jgi:hypothetical protein